MKADPRTSTIVEGGSTPVVGMRESSVVSLARVGALDADQVEAAFHFANIYRQAMQDGGRAFREYVDGGQTIPLAERQADALQELRRARALTGKRGYELLVSVVGHGYGLADLYRTRRQRDTAADELRMHLADLFAMWVRTR